MARPLRIQYPGAFYHIMSRGNGGQKIFVDDVDYQIFLEELKKTIEDHNWLSFAYCLMPNHYYLFIQTIDPNLSIGMRQLNGNYTQRSNILHKRFGHLFQDRFKSVLVEDNGYQGLLIRYITLNPVKAKLVKKLSQYKYSSHREIIGLAKSTGCVHVSKTLSCFHENKKQRLIEYVNYIKKEYDEKDTWNDLRSGMILGSIDFAKNIMNKHSKSKSIENIKKERFLGRPSLKDIFLKTENKVMRNKLILKAYRRYGYTQVEIGNHLNLHYASISRIIKSGGV